MLSELPLSAMTAREEVVPVLQGDRQTRTARVMLSFSLKGFTRDGVHPREEERGEIRHQ
jgi:hypothetical protein